jgi:beta-glucosidase
VAEPKGAAKTGPQPGVATGRPLAERAKALLSVMELDEKASLTAGSGMWHTSSVPRLGVARVKMTDGPNGARGAASASSPGATPSLCTPSESALGATWDPGLVSEVAGAVARQAVQKSARILLAPTVNLQRHPLWGRNFECFSEDPLLSGKLAAAYVKGAQENGVIATVKHFVCNETEHERRTSSSEVDERALRELYLLPFEFAIREGRARALMTSYNRLNGRYLADDARLLGEVLRGEWGFQGVVMTDWWALASTVEAAKAGLDLEMPGPGRAFGPPLAAAVRAGQVPEAVLDDKARRLLLVLGAVGALDGPLEDTEAPIDSEEDRALARRAANEAIVCLRNAGGLLPLDARSLRKVALIGPGATKLALTGGGSAKVTPHYELSLAEVLAGRVGRAGQVLAEPGDDVGRAVAAAKAADVALVVVGTGDDIESEGFDRTSMGLPGRQNELVEAVVEANRRTIVALNTGAPVALPFVEGVPAILQCWFGGQELANALCDVVFGDAEPGGRLPFSLPERLEHTPAFGSFPGESSKTPYSEGQLVGYRWYEARRLPVLFPFGHGLSYTSFTVGPVRLSVPKLARGGSVKVEVPVTNTGARPGSEVVQAYVAPPGGGELRPGGRLRPKKALKAFAKVHLRPGESKVVELELVERSFAYYDVADPDWFSLREKLAQPEPQDGLHRQVPGWYLDAGTYEVQVGRSPQEIWARLFVEVAGSAEPLPSSAPPG